jgi:hypothetical protein
MKEKLYYKQKGLTYANAGTNTYEIHTIQCQSVKIDEHNIYRNV